MFVAVLWSCEGQLETDPVTSSPKPEADAGSNQNIKTGSLVQLDASDSQDPKQSGLTYRWVFVTSPASSNTVLRNDETITPEFIADVSGEYVLSVTVSDGVLSSISYVTVVSSVANSAPVANAGANQNVFTTALIRLDGSESTDADKDTLSFSWLLEKPQGSNAVLSSLNAVAPTFIADRDGRYVVSLTVNDGEFSSEADNVIIVSSTANSAPVANAGINQNVSTGSLVPVMLDGSDSSDADVDNLSFNWVLTVPEGSQASLSSSSAVMPEFMADVDGRFVATLTVNDGLLTSPSDTVVITSSTANSAPIADAGPAQSVNTGSQVKLDGSKSDDADKDNLTFSWVLSKPANSQAVLSSTSAVSPTFNADSDGSYLVSLTVSDGVLMSQVDTVLITSSAANVAPTADAGANQSVSTGTNVELNAIGSMDVNGDDLSYSWVLATRPMTSGAALVPANTQITNFTADVDGDYVVNLIVNDGQLNSELDSVVISATTSNSPPVADAGANQNVTTGAKVNLDGRASDDPNNDNLSYDWSLSVPADSIAVLDDPNIATPSFTADKDGEYLVSLTVSDGFLFSRADSLLVQSATQAASDIDLFDGDGALIGYTVNNATDLPDVARVNGRYRANLVDNSGDKTLHYNNVQGRLDAKLVSFPFEVIVRNIGIGTQSDSQTAPTPNGYQFIFAGVQVHVLDLASKNSSHIVVGHRGSTSFTVEGKNTVDGSSSVDDAGQGVASSGRVDLRIVGNSNRSLTVYWQSPVGVSQSDNWQLYEGYSRGGGALPGGAPSYGASVYVGLITYAQSVSNLPFVGTADSFEIIQ